MELLQEHLSMALIEKKTRDWWTIYQKWSVVEALLGSGMTVDKNGGRREWFTAFILRIAYIKDNVVVIPENPYRLYIKDSLY